ncbi:hypothetical protein ACMHYB_31820 [Sorangium sp. So ce1128]
MTLRVARLVSASPPSMPAGLAARLAAYEQRFGKLPGGEAR